MFEFDRRIQEAFPNLSEFLVEVENLQSAAFLNAPDKVTGKLEWKTSLAIYYYEVVWLLLFNVI